ncbi:hypothetical protein ACLEBV_14575, partial [Escherichia coli]
MNRTDELRTARIESLVTPAELALRYPVTPHGQGSGSAHWGALTLGR